MTNHPIVQPRQTPSRDDRYMALAIVYAGMSKDPYTQMGAFIVTPDNLPRGGGYNGPSKEIKDNSFNWAREAGKNDLIIHAEKNAVKYANGPVRGCTMYVTGFPCIRCMNEQIVDTGIARVVYLDRPYDKGSMQDSAAFERSMEIAKMGGVIVEKYEGSVAWLSDWFAYLEQKSIVSI